MKFKVTKYPVVLKNAKTQKLTIVYKNRVEFYDLSGKDTLTDPMNEIRMASENGYFKVNDEFEKEITI